MSSQAQADSDEQVLARLADTEYLVRRSLTKGYQLFSILTPPIYAGVSIFRKGRAHLTVNRLLRATWLGGAAGRCYETSIVPHIPHIFIQVSPVVALLSMSGPRIQVQRPFGLAGSALHTTYSHCYLVPSHDPDALYILFLQTDALRADDHATIGALLFAVLTPAIFWKRAAAIHRRF
jgi:hypothetical protein